MIYRIRSRYNIKARGKVLLPQHRSSNGGKKSNLQTMANKKALYSFFNGIVYQKKYDATKCRIVVPEHLVTDVLMKILKRHVIFFVVTGFQVCVNTSETTVSHFMFTYLSYA